MNLNHYLLSTWHSQRAIISLSFAARLYLLYKNCFTQDDSGLLGSTLHTYILIYTYVQLYLIHNRTFISTEPVLDDVTELFSWKKYIYIDSLMSYSIFFPWIKKYNQCNIMFNDYLVVNKNIEKSLKTTHT